MAPPLFFWTTEAPHSSLLLLLFAGSMKAQCIQTKGFPFPQNLLSNVFLCGSVFIDVINQLSLNPETEFCLNSGITNIFSWTSPFPTSYCIHNRKIFSCLWVQDHVKTDDAFSRHFFLLSYNYFVWMVFFGFFSFSWIEHAAIEISKGYTIVFSELVRLTSWRA